MEFKIERVSLCRCEDKPVDKAYKREIDDEDVWCINIETLEELVEFINSYAEYDGIIVEKNEDIGRLPRITIYDGWIE